MIEMPEELREFFRETGRIGGLRYASTRTASQRSEHSARGWLSRRTRIVARQAEAEAAARKNP
jgi:hypothetical protein